MAELTPKEKREAVNTWHNDFKHKPIKRHRNYRKMIPMVVNGEFRLTCPDSGYYQKELPEAVRAYYFKHKKG